MNQPLCEKLKAARESRGLSLADVAHLTRIPVPRLLQLEEGNFAAFGNMAYARGFLRNYSQFLEVDAEPFIDSLPEPVLGGAADYRHLTESFGPWISERGPRLPAHRQPGRGASPAFTALLLTLVVGAGMVVFTHLYIAPSWRNKAAAASAGQTTARKQLLPAVPARPMETGYRAGPVPAEMNVAGSSTLNFDAPSPRVPYRRGTVVAGDPARNHPLPQ